MKIRRRITSAIIIIVVIVIVAFRLFSNKQSFDNQLKMVSELNTTIPVMTDTVRFKQIANGFSINGSITPFQEVSVASEAQGRIISIYAETGDIVKMGQVLAKTDNEISASQLALAKFNLEKAEKDLKRFEQLSQGDAATVQQYESVKQVYVNAGFAYTSAKVQNDNAFIKAPFPGYITKRYIENGTFITSGTSVFDLVEIDKVKLIAKLTVTEVAKVKKGQNAEVTIEAYTGVKYEGIVSNILVKADLSKRYDVEVDVLNHADNLIKPGMFGTVFFNSDSNAPLLVIPRKAIANSILNPEVFIVKGDSVTIKNIVVGSIDDKFVVVKSGLNEGDIIVTSGQINLVNGSKIRINN